LSSALWESAIGWVWAVIHPLVLLVSWYWVFTVCMGVTLPKTEVTQNYPLFLFGGRLPWLLLFSDSVQRSASSVLEQGSLITKTVFPAEMIPISVFLSTLVGRLLGLALMVGAVAVILSQISVFLVLLPLYNMLSLGLLSVRLGWIVARLHVFLRDTAQVVSVMTFWFWVTPSWSANSGSSLGRVLCCSPIRSSTSFAPIVNFC
jgi:ABC-type polysaccharide/polyol phosphate export permease